MNEEIVIVIAEIITVIFVIVFIILLSVLMRLITKSKKQKLQPKVITDRTEYENLVFERMKQIGASGSPARTAFYSYYILNDSFWDIRKMFKRKDFKKLKRNIKQFDREYHYEDDDEDVELLESLKDDGYVKRIKDIKKFFEELELPNPNPEPIPFVESPEVIQEDYVNVTRMPFDIKCGDETYIRGQWIPENEFYKCFPKIDWVKVKYHQERSIRNVECVGIKHILKAFGALKQFNENNFAMIEYNPKFIAMSNAYEMLLKTRRYLYGNPPKEWECQDKKHNVYVSDRFPQESPEVIEKPEGTPIKYEISSDGEYTTDCPYGTKYSDLGKAYAGQNDVLGVATAHCCSDCRCFVKDDEAEQIVYCKYPQSHLAFSRYANYKKREPEPRKYIIIQKDEKGWWLEIKNVNLITAFYLRTDVNWISGFIKALKNTHNFNESELLEATNKFYDWYLENGTDHKEDSGYCVAIQFINPDIEKLFEYDIYGYDWLSNDLIKLTSYQYIYILKNYPELKLEKIIKH